MRILLVGKRASITHWLEDAARAFQDDGHAVRQGVVRRPWLNARLESALAEPLAEALARSAASFAPELILAIGGFHVPRPYLERLAALRDRPALVGWVGDIFDDRARDLAALYDLVAYTDRGLEARHRELGLRAATLFLPHAANMAAARPAAGGARLPRAVFAASATPGRRAIVEAITRRVDVFGPGWSRAGGPHAYHGRISHAMVARRYASHLAALNIRNEYNVLSGLNQRSFDPYLSATPVLSDRQGDLESCFDPGVEVVVWDSVEELNAAYDRLLRDPAEAARIGAAGRRRVLSKHRYTHRLAALRRAL